MIPDAALIVASGMATSVGLGSDASCAAMRAKLAGFVETRFTLSGEWLIGCAVPLERACLGRERQLEMLEIALRDCLSGVPRSTLHEAPLFVALSERERAGRPEGLDVTLLGEMGRRFGLTLHPDSDVLPGGRTAGVEALERARDAVRNGCPAAIVAGVDSYLTGSTLQDLNKRRRLLTAENSDGFIPGEAASAILVVPGSRSTGSELRCTGIGYGREKAVLDSEEPLRSDGLSAAFQTALRDAQASWTDLDYQIGSMSGEQYHFREAALAALRSIRPVKRSFDLWHPSDCIGEVGAAIVPCMLGLALASGRKGYAPGPGVLCFSADDDGRRAAVILQSQGSHFA